jgi:acyl dehydratase
MSDTDRPPLTLGDELAPLELEPVSRLTLALYAGASGDHNPIHVDIDVARDAGLDDVIAHGMLSMAYMARLVTAYAAPTAVRSLHARFSAMTHVGDRLTCRGNVAEVFEAAGEKRALLSLEVVDEKGERKLTGEAVIGLPIPHLSAASAGSER